MPPEDPDFPRDPDSRRDAESPRSKDGPPPPKGLFDTLADELKNVGQFAERYTRIGIGMTHIEKLRYDLKNAYASLGETVVRNWSDAPEIGVMPTDPSIQKTLKKIRELRAKIREVESKVATLKQ